MGKVMKSMKAMKALRKGILKNKNKPGQSSQPVNKKPASNLDGELQQEQNGSAQSFLDGVTSGQREALWGRFSRAREALHNQEVDATWNRHCKGPGSDPNKKQLLKVYLENKGNVKKSNHFMNEILQFSQTSGHKDSQEWVPFAVILQRFGLQEAMRRVTWFDHGLLFAVCGCKLCFA